MNLKCLLGHSPASPATYLTEGSCEQGYTCIRCGQTITTGIVHQFGPLVPIGSQPCPTQHTCSRCGQVEIFDHQWGSESVGGERYYQGAYYEVYYRECTLCGTSDSRSDLEDPEE